MFGFGGREALSTSNEEMKKMVENEINFFEKHKYLTYALIGLAVLSLVACGVFCVMFG